MFNIHDVFGSLKGTIRATRSFATELVLNPQLPSKKIQALREVTSLKARNGEKLKNHATYVLDWKRLERNKYAPWGRGDLGGKPCK